MTRYGGWDEAGRQGANAAGRMPQLTERKDLGSINHDTKAGWGDAVPGGCKKRVDMKLGPRRPRRNLGWRALGSAARSGGGLTRSPPRLPRPAPWGETVMHSKRDEGGMYRPLSPAEERCERAQKLTQTHEGRFTHSRDADARRMKLAVTVPKDLPMFRDKRVNRDAYRPKVTK